MGCEKISDIKSREYINELLSLTLEASTDSKGDKRSGICLIPPNITMSEKAKKQTNKQTRSHRKRWNSIESWIFFFLKKSIYIEDY